MVWILTWSDIPEKKKKIFSEPIYNLINRLILIQYKSEFYFDWIGFFSPFPQLLKFNKALSEFKMYASLLKFTGAALASIQNNACYSLVLIKTICAFTVEKWHDLERRSPFYSKGEYSLITHWPIHSHTFTYCIERFPQHLMYSPSLHKCVTERIFCLAGKKLAWIKHRKSFSSFIFNHLKFWCLICTICLGFLYS